MTYPNNKMEKICYICQHPGDLVQSCPNCSIWSHVSCFTNQLNLDNMQCGICKSQLRLVHQKKFSTEKLIGDCIKKLKELYVMFIVILTGIILYYGSLGKNYSDHRVNPDAGPIFLCVILVVPIFLTIRCRDTDTEPSFCKFAESVKILSITIVPVILFLVIMFIHTIGYIFMNKENDFFTHMTFVTGFSVISLGLMGVSVCYTMICEFMNWCNYFIDYYSETEIKIEHVK